MTLHDTLSDEVDCFRRALDRLTAARGNRIPEYHSTLGQRETVCTTTGEMLPYSPADQMLLIRMQAEHEAAREDLGNRQTVRTGGFHP